MGGKRRLLKQLLPLFPKDINTLYDLFAGGGTISLNTKAGATGEVYITNY